MDGGPGPTASKVPEHRQRPQALQVDQVPDTRARRCPGGLCWLIVRFPCLAVVVFSQTRTFIRPAGASHRYSSRIPTKTVRSAYQSHMHFATETQLVAKDDSSIPRLGGCDLALRERRQTVQKRMFVRHLLEAHAVDHFCYSILLARSDVGVESAASILSRANTLELLVNSRLGCHSAAVDMLIVLWLLLFMLHRRN
ncbi:predicted protein [Uncinocarpus reesii 1704]|uniref:Uncharacterized protein n=1 Tax=Uncinocarpus reesii (strain UAMH 1704) TaxID=336963 RepID=C4JZ39_UNCRE|nr:uncharacterized protein UREG_07440 [Uncinocarpus reesii 1704]EEP82575.1 predicted protein [Uncinocarpus reesii 1704]